MRKKYLQPKSGVYMLLPGGIGLGCIFGSQLAVANSFIGRLGLQENGEYGSILIWLTIFALLFACVGLWSFFPKRWYDYLSRRVVFGSNLFLPLQYKKAGSDSKKNAYIRQLDTNLALLVNFESLSVNSEVEVLIESLPNFVTDHEISISGVVKAQRNIKGDSTSYHTWIKLDPIDIDFQHEIAAYFQSLGIEQSGDLVSSPEGKYSLWSESTGEKNPVT